MLIHYDPTIRRALHLGVLLCIALLVTASSMALPRLCAGKDHHRRKDAVPLRREPTVRGNRSRDPRRGQQAHPRETSSLAFKSKVGHPYTQENARQDCSGSPGWAPSRPWPSPPNRERRHRLIVTVDRGLAVHPLAQHQADPGERARDRALDLVQQPVRHRRPSLGATPGSGAPPTSASATRIRSCRAGA